MEITHVARAEPSPLGSGPQGGQTLCSVIVVRPRQEGILEEATGQLRRGGQLRQLGATGGCGQLSPTDQAGAAGLTGEAQQLWEGRVPAASADPQSWPVTPEVRLYPPAPQPSDFAICLVA